MKLFNNLVPYADQLGSRPMAANFLIPLWHVDAPTCLPMKDRNSPLDIQCTNLNITFSIPDLFYKRCMPGSETKDDPIHNKGIWSFFCPRETQILYAKLNGKDHRNSKIVDQCPSLHDLWGTAFEEFYIQCEQAGIARDTIKAKDFERKIAVMRCSVGEPFLFNIDNVNRKSNHQHLGTITQSNLCMEICQFTRPGDISATCDLATLNLASFVRDQDGKKGVDYERMGTVTRQLVRNLNRVIDRTSGVLPNEG